MSRTSTASKTVITLLAPNPTAGKRALQAMTQLSGRVSLSEEEASSPGLSAHPLLRSILPRLHWNSIHSEDKRMIVQCISISPWTTSSTEPSFRVIGIQEREAKDEVSLRKQLTQHIRNTIPGPRASLMLVSRRFPSTMRPLLDVQDVNETSEPVFRDGDIKEVVLHELLVPSLPQLVTGVYKTPRGLRIRPLPPAAQDHSTSAPTVVFHQSKLPDDDRFRRIGYTGRNHGGQLLLKHPDALGLRLCQAQAPRSMFAEAQDSLLASSLGDLQSKLVLNGHGEDPRRNKADCWVEFRAQVASPSGYWKKRLTN